MPAAASRLTVSVPDTLPRFSRLAARSRSGSSSTSSPLGKRNLMSRPRPFTLRSSQVQDHRAHLAPDGGQSRSWRPIWFSSLIGWPLSQEAARLPICQYRNIALTGASSGLGRALALELAAPGVTLHLGGRDAARLTAVAAEVRARGAGTTETLLDVTNQDGMEAWVRGIPGLDLAIANAGISAGPGKGPFESSGQTRAVFATNVDGVFNTVLPALGTAVRAYRDHRARSPGSSPCPAPPPIPQRKRRWISGCGVWRHARRGRGSF